MMNKPTAYSGKPYPFTQLSDREFEEVVYHIFQEAIKEGEYAGHFDQVDILTGVGEQGRDCKLYLKGTVVGNIQCKNYEENIAKTQLLDELLKFVLNYLMDSRIIPDEHNFTYFLVAAKGFSTSTIDFVGEINKRIDAEPELDERIRLVINKSSSFMKSSFTVDSTRPRIIRTIKNISIKLINGTDLNRMLFLYASHIADRFFEIRKVVDADSIREIIEELLKKDINRSSTTFEQLLDIAIQQSKKLVHDLKSNLTANRRDIQGALINHLRSTYQWCSEISFNDLKKAKRTSGVFVELDMYLYPRRLRLDANEEVELVSLNDIFKGGYRHFVILGQPGAGKTTSAKYLCHKILTDPHFHPELFNMPIVISFSYGNSALTASMING